MVSLFGSSVSEVLFECRACRTMFNWVKLRGRLPPCAWKKRALDTPFSGVYGVLA